MVASNFDNTSERGRLDLNFALVSCIGPRSCNDHRCIGDHPELIQMPPCYQARFEWDVWVIVDCYSKLVHDPCSGSECRSVLFLANSKAVKPSDRMDLNSH